MKVSVFYMVLLTGSMQLLLASSGNGQSINDIKVTVGMRKGQSLESLFKNIEKQSGLLFAFDYQKVNQYNDITLEKATRTIKETLEIVLEETPFIYRQVKNNVVIFQEGEEPETFLVNKDEEMENPFRIKGKVTDAEGAAMAGVNVIVKGTTRGTSTDAEGKFAIDAEDSEVLVFSFIGFKTFETQVNARVLIDVTLEEEVEALKEVVINAGYYNVKEREKTGSISKVDSKIIEKQPVTNPLAALQGRMPGVFIEQTSGVPGSEFKIQIRGRNSLRLEGNQPLYIVDGVPYSTEKTFSDLTSSGTFGQTTPGVSGASPLTSLNPADIESIEVLKDADATAIYGSRGANGVVLITTKKAMAGKTVFDLNMFSGVALPWKVKVLNTPQFLALRREAFANDGLTPSANPADPGYSPELMIWDTSRYTNWQKELIGSWAQTTSVQGSVSGGSDHTQVIFSLGYRRENTADPGDFGYQKGSFHLAGNHTSASNKFLFRVTLNGSRDQNHLPNHNFSFDAIGLAPNAPALHDENGSLNWENSTWTNPLAKTAVTYHNEVVNFTGNTVAGYEVTEGLHAKVSLGVNFLQSSEHTKSPHTEHDPAYGFTSAQSIVLASGGINRSWIMEPQINYERKIAKGNLTLLTGCTFQEQHLERKADIYKGFPNNAMMDNLGAATSTSNHEFVISLYRYGAVFGRLNYNWEGKYVLNLTGRRDGSSRFGPGKQFANFGAVGAAWIFSNEVFVKDRLPIISFGKLRTSYGSTGNDQIGDYKFIDSYSTNQSVTLQDQYQGVTWLSPSSLFNPDYAWEINKKFEVALEMAFLKDRLSLTVSHFRNRSSNQLINYTLPRTTGFSGILANLPATVQNIGWEVELTTLNTQVDRGIQWISSFNLTTPRNKLLEFPDLESSTFANRYVVGESLSIQKAFESLGVDPETGLWVCRDVNGDGIVSRPEDNTKVVFVGEKFYGGLNNSLTFRGWTFDLFFQFVSQISHSPLTSGLNIPGQNRNIPETILNQRIWRQPGDIAEIQKLATRTNKQADIARQNYGYSDVSWVDASFIRLKNISLSYRLPKKWTESTSCRLYFHGQNLLVVTASDVKDPELDSNQFWAPLRMFTVGAQITF